MSAKCDYNANQRLRKQETSLYALTISNFVFASIMLLLLTAIIEYLLLSCPTPEVLDCSIRVH